MATSSSLGSVLYTMMDATPRDEVSSQLLACNNGKKDPLESDIDCGGPCKKCVYGDACLLPADCTTNYCISYS